MDVNHEILMEAGTNELEILIFGIGQEKFGINVAKVREVIRPQETFSPPKVHPMVDGVIHLRGQVLPLINLRRAIGYPEKEPSESDRIIIAEFHKNWFGFMVDNVSTIVRISWGNIEAPPEMHQHRQVLTGIAHYNESLILMLDVETLTQPLFAELDLVDKASELDSDIVQRRASKRILTADDSGMIRTLVKQKLNQAGYTDIIVTENGAVAWDTLEKDPTVDLVISDIEMPQLDGLHLTKLIKSDDRYKDKPVIVFSSIISEDNRNKGEQVGVDDQISKPEIERLVETVDRLLAI
jgi:two-component system chemotaxis response regulator CheV